MAKDDGGMGFPSGTCPDSDHIASERARLKSASVKHFAQGRGAQPASPPRPVQGTGSPNPGQPGPTLKGRSTPSPGPADLEDEM